MSRAAQSIPEHDDLACACATARRAAHALTRMYDVSLRSAELEAPQFALLNMLDKVGPCSQAAMGRKFALEKTTLSRNLKFLEGKGWVEPAPGRDARERCFVVTADGRERLTAARPAWRKAQQRVRASLTAAQWNAMWDVFHALTEAARDGHADFVRQRAKKSRGSRPKA
jgi:DNA-binding MarR family transcriptional regulator